MTLRLETKKNVVQTMNDRFQTLNSAFLIEYRGLNVAALTELRVELKKFDSDLHIVKNTLAQIASKGTPIESLVADFKGPTAITYADANPVEVTKFLLKFINDHPLVSIKSAMFEGKKVHVKELDDLAKLPSKEALHARLLGVMLAPIQQLYTVMQENSRQVVRVLQARIDNEKN